MYFLRSKVPGPLPSPLWHTPNKSNFRKDAAAVTREMDAGAQLAFPFYFIWEFKPWKGNHPQLVPGNPFIDTHRGVSAR